MALDFLHPSAAKLRHWLETGESDRVGIHVEQCERCADRLEQLDAEHRPGSPDVESLTYQPSVQGPSRAGGAGASTRRGGADAANTDGANSGLANSGPANSGPGSAGNTDPANAGDPDRVNRTAASMAAALSSVLVAPEGLNERVVRRVELASKAEREFALFAGLLTIGVDTARLMASVSDDASAPAMRDASRSERSDRPAIEGDQS